MVTTSRVDVYARRIAEVKGVLELNGWTKVREDEWRNRDGESLRFSYAHMEFRLHLKINGRKPEWHALHVQDEPHPVPTVAQILRDILELDITASVRG